MGMPVKWAGGANYGAKGLKPLFFAQASRKIIVT